MLAGSGRWAAVTRHLAQARPSCGVPALVSRGARVAAPDRCYVLAALPGGRESNQLRNTRVARYRGRRSCHPVTAKPAKPVLSMQIVQCTWCDRFAEAATWRLGQRKRAQQATGPRRCVAAPAVHCCCSLASRDMTLVAVQRMSGGACE